MSILFFDRLIVLDGLDKRLKKIFSSSDERHEMWKYVEEIIHHKVMGCCLENLPNDKHTEFMDMFVRSPYDPYLIKYLDKHTNKDMEKTIKAEIKKLTKDLLLLESNKA